MEVQGKHFIQLLETFHGSQRRTVTMCRIFTKENECLLVLKDKSKNLSINFILFINNN